MRYPSVVRSVISRCVVLMLAVSVPVGAVVFPPVTVAETPPLRGAAVRDSQDAEISEHDCPYGIPVVSLPVGPHQSGFNWSGPIRPLGDPCVKGVIVDPADENVWYVTGHDGLYVTRDGGATWTHPLTGFAESAVLASSDQVYVSISSTLYLSTDRGLAWKPIHTFERPIYSLYATSSGMVYVGPAWGPSPTPNGLYFSPDRGAHWQALPFGGSVSGLICWAIVRDPRDGTLYVGTEIYNHPQPYHPPLLRSQDGGQTWTDVAGTIRWHVVALDVRPTDGYVYALTEGLGLYGSPDHGATWLDPEQGAGPNPELGAGPSVSLLMDRSSPTTLYGGRQNFWSMKGGAFVSANAGRVFEPIGLEGATVSGLSFGGGGTRLYAAAYASGIYVSRVPERVSTTIMASLTIMGKGVASGCRATVAAGTRFALRFALVPTLVGRKVEIWRRIGAGPWKLWTTRVTGSSGAVGSELTARSTMSYRARFAGVATARGAWSGVCTVRVRTQ